jgi:signal transduction histidine kinase
MPPNLLLYLPTEPLSMPAPDSRQRPAAEAGLMTPSLRRLLQITTLLLLLYFALLVLLDAWFVRVRPGGQVLPDLYYAGHIGLALGALLLIRWRWLQSRLGGAFLPLVIASMSLAPILLDRLTLPAAPVGPLIAQAGLLSLRLAPSICLGLVLVAWYYPWWYGVGYVLGTSGLTILTNLHSLGTIIPAMVLQSITLLLFGYCISVLTARLNLQRSELMEANRQLQEFASTQERLTISRERNRVARELHDTLAHTLSGLTVQLEAIKAYWAVDPAAARTMRPGAPWAPCGSARWTIWACAWPSRRWSSRPPPPPACASSSSSRTTCPSSPPTLSRRCTGSPRRRSPM